MKSFLQCNGPYPGLRPFQKGEWSIFFGREQMVDAVLDKLSQRQLVFVHGSSGCGKSSLIRAGVLPRLESEHSRHGIGWRTATMRPGSSPLWSLASAIAKTVENVRDDAEPSLGTTRTIRKLLNSGVDAFARIQQHLGLGRDCNVSILLDQFEELFRYGREIGPEEAETVIEVLRGFEFDKETNKNPPQGIHVIVTMRSDHLGDCGHFVNFAELVNDTQYLLPRISDEGLICAIREPARLFGGNVEVPLIMRLVEESRHEIDALPLVQHALMRLWEKGIGPIKIHQQKTSSCARLPLVPTLHMAEYRGLQRTLSEHADEVLNELRDDDIGLELTTQYLFRAITEVDAEGRGIRAPKCFTKLVEITGGNEEKLQKVIKRLSRDDCGFIFRGTGDDPVIDISHEALLRCWQKVNDKNINIFTGLPTGWIYREKADRENWKAALLSLGLNQADTHRKKGIWVKIRKFVDASITIGTFGILNRFRLSSTFSDKWFSQLPGKGWTEGYGGYWDELKFHIRMRKIGKILLKLIGITYSVLIVLSVIATILKDY